MIDLKKVSFLNKGKIKVKLSTEMASFILENARFLIDEGVLSLYDLEKLPDKPNFGELFLFKKSFGSQNNSSWKNDGYEYLSRNTKNNRGFKVSRKTLNFNGNKISVEYAKIVINCSPNEYQRRIYWISNSDFQSRIFIIQYIEKESSCIKSDNLEIVDIVPKKVSSSEETEFILLLNKPIESGSQHLKVVFGVSELVRTRGIRLFN